MNRWNSLRPREKEIVWRYVVLGEKRFTVGSNIGVGLSRMSGLLDGIYRVLAVNDAMELAFFVGRNYEQVEMDAVALGFEMPKELTMKGTT